MKGPWWPIVGQVPFTFPRQRSRNQACAPNARVAVIGSSNAKSLWNLGPEACASGNEGAPAFHLRTCQLLAAEPLKDRRPPSECGRETPHSLELLRRSSCNPIQQPTFGWNVVEARTSGQKWVDEPVGEPWSVCSSRRNTPMLSPRAPHSHAMRAHVDARSTVRARRPTARMLCNAKASAAQRVAVD